MDRIIEVIIAPGGAVKMETQGFAGEACEQATRALQDALGETTSDERTSEFYETEKAKATS